LGGLQQHFFTLLGEPFFLFSGQLVSPRGAREPGSWSGTLFGKKLEVKVDGVLCLLSLGGSLISLLEFLEEGIQALPFARGKSVFVAEIKEIPQPLQEKKCSPEERPFVFSASKNLPWSSRGMFNITASCRIS